MKFITFNLAHQLPGESFSNAAWRMASPPVATTAYTVNGLNQYPSVGGTTHSWDAQGNLTANGVWTFGFDAENHLLTASKSGVAAVYAYDPRGRRTQKSGTGVTTTLFVDSGDDEIAEYDGNNALVRRFIPGPAIDQPVAMVTAAGVRSYFHANHQGSVVAMSDASGALAEGPYTYDAYGNASSTAGEPYKFTGRRLDVETGLYYYRARYYSSTLGRFLQTDPIGYKDDFDLYTYAGNDPENRGDPSGRDVVFYTEAAGGYYVAGGEGARGVAVDLDALRRGELSAYNFYTAGVGGGGGEAEGGYAGAGAGVGYFAGKMSDFHGEFVNETISLKQLAGVTVSVAFPPSHIGDPKYSSTALSGGIGVAGASGAMTYTWFGDQHNVDLTKLVGAIDKGLQALSGAIEVNGIIGSRELDDFEKSLRNAKKLINEFKNHPRNVTPQADCVNDEEHSCGH